MLGTSAEEKVIVPERLVVCSCFVARVPPGLHGSKLVLWHCILLLYARPAGRATRKRACVLSVGLRVLCGGGYSAGRGPRAGFTDAGSSLNFDVLLGTFPNMVTTRTILAACPISDLKFSISRSLGSPSHCANVSYFN